MESNMVGEAGYLEVVNRRYADIIQSRNRERIKHILLKTLTIIVVYVVADWVSAWIDAKLIESMAPFELVQL